MAEKHCKQCNDCINHGTCYIEGNRKAYKGDLDISECKHYKHAVNFAEVVWCKDCENYVSVSPTCGNCFRTTCIQRPNDFCSRSVKRKEATP